MLDKTVKYGYLDKSENFWRFSHEKIGDEMAWFAYLAKPGEKGLFIGKIPEIDLERRLKENLPPLGQDDLIDLELWINHGGLDEFAPKGKKKKK